MFTHYVEDVSGWEKWQQKYRYGVFLLLPSEPLMTQANAIREQYDKLSAMACDAHISLTIPLPQPLLSVHWKELEDIASQFKSFSILYGPLKNYLPHPGVCLAIEPQEQLDKLRSSLESATAFEGAKKRKYPFSAHLTLAEFIDVERTKELMMELSDSIPQGYFDCTAVSYAVPDESFRFIERARLVLG